MKLRLTHPLVKEFVTTKAGDNAHKVVKSILKKGVTDEEISGRTGLQVNEIRAVLNRLQYLGVITYSKERAKKTNWYTYTWFLDKERINELLADRYTEELAKLKERIEMFDTYVFFKCANGCDKLPFELAFEYNFMCPECGKGMKEVNIKREKKHMKKRMKEIEHLLC